MQPVPSAGKRKQPNHWTAQQTKLNSTTNAIGPKRGKMPSTQHLSSAGKTHVNRATKLSELKRLVFTGDGVGVVVGVVRAPLTEWKSKIGVVSGVIRSTESESEESERFHFLPIPLMTPTLMIQWKLDCRSRKQKQINQSQCPSLLTTPTI